MWLRQEVEQKRIQVNWVPTDQMPADGLTKILSRPKHESFVKQLGLEDIRSRVTLRENEEEEKRVELLA
jgi:ribosomal protein L30/L7E